MRAAWSAPGQNWRATPGQRKRERWKVVNCTALASFRLRAWSHTLSDLPRARPRISSCPGRRSMWLGVPVAVGFGRRAPRQISPGRVRPGEIRRRSSARRIRRPPAEPARAPWNSAVRVQRWEPDTGGQGVEPHRAPVRAGGNEATGGRRCAKAGDRSTATGHGMDRRTVGVGVRRFAPRPGHLVRVPSGADPHSASRGRGPASAPPGGR